jgi:hypothetical protein
MQNTRLAVVASVAATLSLTPLVSADFFSERIGSGFIEPLFATADPSQPDTLFVVEKGGRIRTVDLTTGSVTGTFLDLSGQVSTASERGLLGLAFAPDYATSGEFYVSYTDNSGDSTIARYERSGSNPLVADTAGQIVLQFDQPASNHNGGWIGFSPTDGDNLYFSVGDGGGANDQAPGSTPGIGYAQDGSSLLGKLLRFDVGGSDFGRTYTIPSDNPFVGDPGVNDLIAADGLRNAFRGSFDRETGDLYLGDVGQAFREEINLMPAGELGYNFGWRNREGYIATPTPDGDPVGGPKPMRNADPIFDYAHNFNSATAGTAGTGERPVLGRTITGGYVYRGERLGPDLYGKYIFGDFIFGRVYALDVSAAQSLNQLSDFSDLEDLDLPFDDITEDFFPGGSVGPLASFGEDADGELYTIAINGNVRRLDFDKPEGDANYDGVVNLSDFLILRRNFGDQFDEKYWEGDFNGDDRVNLSDFLILRRNFGAGTADGPGGPGSGLLDDFYQSIIPEPGSISLLAGVGLLAMRRRR